eukprot:SAG31_NODE_526_length_14475_cov_5.135197_5_plen_74_part_00
MSVPTLYTKMYNRTVRIKGPHFNAWRRRMVWLQDSVLLAPPLMLSFFPCRCLISLWRRKELKKFKAPRLAPAH